ncbi:MAG: cysteine desulfurase family protein [Caulobacterales bacterium]
MVAVYLDYNATAKVRPEAAAAVAHALEVGGNPSSVHAAGRAARQIMENARAQVAALAGVVPGSVTFLSGGTEANGMAIESAVFADIQRIIVGATEHPSVMETAAVAGLPVEIMPVDGEGVADLAWLEAELADGRKTLVCLMLANNETGAIQPVADASRVVRANGGWLHVDAIQAAGKIPLDFSALGADTLSISAHKLGGPQGVGALVAGARARLSRRIHGGGQERGLRGGTENVPGIAGFGAAAEASVAQLDALAAQSAWRDGLQAQILRTGGSVMSLGAARLPQTLCFATPGFASDLQVMGLDLAGVMISAGSACSSGKVKPSPVIEAMGRPDLAAFTVRVSGGWATTEADWLRCGEAWAEIFHRHRQRHGAPAAA